MDNVENFVDDILEYTESWDSHLETLRTLLLKLRDSGLTAKPSKCVLSYFQLPFFGHTVGNGELSADPGKVLSIKGCSRPATKKNKYVPF